jgi:carbon monoxide dehydrogenase subunit G
MDMTGEHRIDAPRAVVWRALNDADVLRACIPGCTELEKSSDSELSAVVVQKIGPVKAKFAGEVELLNINAPKATPSRARARAALQALPRAARTCIWPKTAKAQS